MKELIKIENREGIETVNARELHERMQVATRFNDWIKSRIEKYGFIEGQDFAKVTEKIVTQGGAQGAHSYYLTIDMAKELAMVENNEHGRNIRRYFIDVEKKFRGTYRKYLETRIKSKKVRNDFTDELKDHGIETPKEYIKITTTMKANAGIQYNKKKDDMDRIELARIIAAESLATLRMIEQCPNGYEEVKPICQESAYLVGSKGIV